MAPDFVFLSTLTIHEGVNAPIWEVAACRVNSTYGMVTGNLHMFVDPFSGAADDPPQLPRYNPSESFSVLAAADTLIKFLHDNPILVAEQPYVEAARIEKLWLSPNGLAVPWNQAMISVTDLMAGYASARIGNGGFYGCTELLSPALGVDPSKFRNESGEMTAEGNVLLAMAQWDRITRRLAKAVVPA